MKNNKSNNRKTGLTALVSMSLACALVLGGGYMGSVAAKNAAVAETTEAAETTETVTYSEPSEDPSVALYVAQKNANSVVGVITSEETWSQSAGASNTAVAQGSGVVIREGGYVLTNNHVIEDGESYQVLMPNGDKVDAELIGADSSTDLAVLKIKERADELVPVTLADIDTLKVGSTVIAIGNPGGEVLANTVTQGIVSAMERTSVNASNTTRRISYIQHDAAINSGNSGGGLFNYKGELVGINTLKYSGSSYSSVTFEGLGFAIPVDTVSKIADQLIENGKVIRPGLGVTVAAYSGPDEPMQNYAPASLCVYSVNENGAAEKAGIKQYDFIYEVEGQRITSMMDLTSILDEHEAGDTIKVTLVRYNSVSYQSYNNSMFGYGYGYGYGYGNGNNGSNGSSSDYTSGSGEVVVGNGYDTITVDVTLELLENVD